jgi:hypothetical protein
MYYLAVTASGSWSSRNIFESFAGVVYFLIGNACKRVKIYFENINISVGAKYWRTSMSRIKYSLSTVQ